MQRTTADISICPYDTMLNYHKTMSSIKCDTCFESFPTLSVSLQPNGVIECSRCANDNSGNNMDAGVVPTQLQVQK